MLDMEAIYLVFPNIENHLRLRTKAKPFETMKFHGKERCKPHMIRFRSETSLLITLVFRSLLCVCDTR